MKVLIQIALALWLSVGVAHAGYGPFGRHPPQMDEDEQRNLEDRLRKKLEEMRRELQNVQNAGQRNVPQGYGQEKDNTSRAYENDKNNADLLFGVDKRTADSVSDNQGEGEFSSGQESQPKSNASPYPNYSVDGTHSSPRAGNAPAGSVGVNGDVEALSGADGQGSAGGTVESDASRAGSVPVGGAGGSNTISRTGGGSSVGVATLGGMGGQGNAGSAPTDAGSVSDLPRDGSGGVGGGASDYGSRKHWSIVR